MRRRFGILFIFLLFVVGIILLLERQARVCFENTCFFVEVAETQKERERGLMFRKHLDQAWGMLFVFDKEEEHSFWMKNTLIPLDIIWLDRTGEVVFIEKNAQPCRQNSCPIITPGEKAKFALEINGGMADKIGLNIGDKINLLHD